MYIVHHTHLKSQQHDGEHCVAAADASLGVNGFEVWTRQLEPGARGAELRHEGELVVLVLAGCGKLLVDGGPQRFSAPCTVLVPPRRCVQFVNHGSVALQLVAVSAAAYRQPWPAATRELAPSGDEREARHGDTAKPAGRVPRHRQPDPGGSP